MNKNLLYIIINTIIVMAIIIMCFVVISNNVIKSLQGKKYIIVSEENRETIEKVISQYKEIKGNLIKVEYMQELGDWSLRLYYDDEKVDKSSFGDSKAYEIKQYIRDNGNDEGEESWNKIKISMVIIIVMIIYELVFIRIRCNKQEDKQKNN